VAAAEVWRPKWGDKNPNELPPMVQSRAVHAFLPENLLSNKANAGSHRHDWSFLKIRGKSGKNERS